jgi:hypothetical protein
MLIMSLQPVRNPNGAASTEIKKIEFSGKVRVVKLEPDEKSVAV